MDNSMDNGFRWLTVGPKTQPDLELILMPAKENPMMSADKVARLRQSRQFLVAQRRNCGVDPLRVYLSRFHGLPRLVRREKTLDLLLILPPRLGGVDQFFVDVRRAYNVCLSQDARGAESEQKTSGQQSNRLPQIETHEFVTSRGEVNKGGTQLNHYNGAKNTRYNHLTQAHVDASSDQLD